jgi:hypothetical protein
VPALQQPLQEIERAAAGLTGMAPVFLELLLHGGKDLGGHDGGDRNGDPVLGWDIIVVGGRAGV